MFVCVGKKEDEQTVEIKLHLFSSHRNNIKHSSVVEQISCIRNKFYNRSPTQKYKKIHFRD